MSVCPRDDCDATAWEVVEFSGGEEFAVEKRECEYGHRWTEVLS